MPLPPAVSALYGATIQAAMVVCWSSGFIGAILASQTQSVLIVLFWRFVAASLLLLPFLLPYLKRRHVAALAGQAVIGLFGMYAYVAGAVKAIDLGVQPGTAALIGSLQPLVTAAVAGYVVRERVSRAQWLGLGLGLLGIALAVGVGAGSAPGWGFGLSVLSMLSIVAASLVTKRVSTNLPLLPCLAVHCTVAMLLFLPTALLEGSALPEAEPAFWGAVAWFVLFSTIGGYGFYWLCLRRMSVVRVASLMYLTPPVTMAWAWLMFGEEIGLWAIAGFLVTMIGVALAGRLGPIRGDAAEIR